MLLPEENHLKSEDLEKIILRFPKNGTELVDGTDLLSHSAQYILPVGAIDRQVMFDDILTDRRSEPEIKRLVANTAIEGDSVLDAEYPQKYASVVEIIATDGRQFSRRVDYAAGTPENPFSPEDIKRKFFKLSRPVTGESMAKKIVTTIEQIEFQEDINSLGRLLLNQIG